MNDADFRLTEVTYPLRDPGDEPEPAMSRRPEKLTGRSRRRPSRREAPSRRRVGPWLVAAGIVAAVAAVGAWVWASDRPRRLAARAEGAAVAGDWEGALRAWRAVNATDRASARTLRAEARACLALGRAGQAERALERASTLDPADPEPWRTRLELLRLEDRSVEAALLGRAALVAVPPRAQRGVLRDLTLALLADVPDDLARASLARWAEADPNDLEARVALLRRVAAHLAPGDPSRAERVASLEAILATRPDHAGAREALVLDLASGGDRDRGRAALDAWPEAARDARYDRLRARWDLDYDGRPDRAARALRRALTLLPHDWKLHYGLARALGALGCPDEARAEARAVSSLRELLEPSRLGPRLDAALARADDPASARDLADLCARAGLRDLSEAWSRVAVETLPPSHTPARLGTALGRGRGRAR